MSDSTIFSAIRKLLALLTAKERRQIIKIMSFSACISIFEIVTATAVVVLAQVLNNPETGKKYIFRLGMDAHFSQQKIVLFFALIVGMLYLLKSLFAIGEVFYQHRSIQKINYRFKKKLLNRYAQTDYGFYLTRNSSQGFAVVSSDTESSFTNGMTSLSTITSESIIFLSLIGMVIYIEPKLAIFIAVVGLMLGWVLNRGLLPLFYSWGLKLQTLHLMGEKNLFQFFHAFKEIILIGKRESFIDAYHFYSRKKSKIQALQNVTNILPRIAMELLFVILFVLSIAYFCLFSHNTEQMVGILSGYLYVGFRLMPGLNRIITSLNTFKGTIPSINRMHDEYFHIVEKNQYLDFPDFQFNHSININNVSFSYLNASRNALNDINLQINKGECIGITGETGSGKSTLSDMILGLLKPKIGEVSIDKKYPANSLQWHAQIGYVQQAIYLTDDTIRANIAFGETENEVDHQRLQNAINEAQLTSTIQQLPNGIETIVGERGLRLSGGEKQRIAIARALYRNPHVLIFDESTSALDNETESRLIETIEAIRKTKRTIIMIAHRLTTLKNCDRIIVMHKGKIDKVLTYDELMLYKKENKTVNI